MRLEWPDLKPLLRDCFSARPDSEQPLLSWDCFKTMKTWRQSFQFVAGSSLYGLFEGHHSVIPLIELGLIELPLLQVLGEHDLLWRKYDEWIINWHVKEKGPVVISLFTWSRWDNELRFKSKEPDGPGVTGLEATEELQGYNFLNPHHFYVRTWLTLEVHANAEAERHLNGTLAIYHTSLH